MAALAQGTTKLPLRAAIEARDHAAVLDAFAPDAIVRSPITDGLMFDTREQVSALFRVILDVFEDIHYTDELRSGDSAVLVLRARVDGTDVEVVDHMRLDEEGRIRELTVFFRPLPAIAVAARALGCGLGRRRGRIRALLIGLLIGPLVAMTRIGDRLAVRLVAPALR